MKFFFSKALIQQYPDHCVAFGIVSNITVIGPDNQTQKILTDVYPRVMNKYKDIDLDSLQNTKAYVHTEEHMSNGDRFGFPSDQIARVLSGKEIHNINNIVNMYMKYELLHNLSFSAYDLDVISRYVEIAVNQTTHSIILLGGKEKTIPSNDLVFRDEQGIFYSFTKGYADRTKVTSTTSNVLYVIDAPYGIEKKLVQENIKNLCSEFQSRNFFILDKLNPVVSI